MNKKTMIAGAALGLTGLAWLIMESEIKAMNNKALNHDLAVEFAKDPLHRIAFEELASKFTKKAVLLNRVRLLNPWTYVVPYLDRLYEKYKSIAYNS